MQLVTVELPSITRPPKFDRLFAEQGAFTCSECGTLSVGFDLDPAYFRQPQQALERPGAHLKWFPPRAVGKDFPDVPEHIASAAREATECRSVSALRATILLARSVIEATGKDKGIAKGRLAEKIDEMYARGLIRERIKDAAHEVRYLGNDMAHGDFVDPVDEEDADLILTLMEQVLREVYQEPAQLDRARAARAAKKQGGTP